MAAPVLLPRSAPTHEVLRAAAVAVEQGRRVVMASVVARRGSTPSTPGQKMVLLDDSTALGTIGGGAIERVALTSMIADLRDPASVPHIETFRLGPSLGMCCGGSVDVLIEPLGGAMDVVIIGAGHVGTALAPLLATLGFLVTVCDSREEAADPARFPAITAGALQVLHADHDDPAAIERVGQRGGAAFVVMTHDHQLDQAAIEHGIAQRFGFVGGVGSRAKAARTRARLEAKGFSEGDIGRVRMPVGLDIGARSPAEIAVAIAGELVAFRAGVKPPTHKPAGFEAGEPASSEAGEPASSEAGEPASSEAGEPAA